MSCCMRAPINFILFITAVGSSISHYYSCCSSSNLHRVKFGSEENEVNQNYENCAEFLSSIPPPALRALHTCAFVVASLIFLSYFFIIESSWTSSPPRPPSPSQSQTSFDTLSRNQNFSKKRNANDLTNLNLSPLSLMIDCYQNLP
jgi:hypothetical protein